MIRGTRRSPNQFRSAPTTHAESRTGCRESPVPETAHVYHSRAQPRRSTIPVDPSIVITWPLTIRCMARAAPTTAGMSYSRATIAQ